MNFLESLRASVRPIIAIATVVTILVIAIILISKFATVDMAKQILIFVLATGGIVIGFYFGERSQRPK